MLRRVVLVVACLMVASGMLLWATGHRHGGTFILMAQGGIVALGLVFERIRYKPELTHPPGAGWVRTQEASVDAAGRVTVWFNPETGERAYVRTESQ